MAHMPRLEKRHFEFIAETIARLPIHAPTLRAQRDSTARAFASALASTNDKFNADRFLRACGVAA
jgi:hypothetical protein